MKQCFLLIFVSLIVNRVFSGALDNPRNVFEHFPNVNVDAHMLKIAQRHFADVREGIVPSDTKIAKGKATESAALSMRSMVECLKSEIACVSLRERRK